MAAPRDRYSRHADEEQASGHEKVTNEKTATIPWLINQKRKKPMRSTSGRELFVGRDGGHDFSPGLADKFGDGNNLDTALPERVNDQGQRADGLSAIASAVMEQDDVPARWSSLLLSMLASTLA